MGAVLDLVRVLFEPGAVFDRVRERPRVLVPLLTVMVVSLVLGFLARPYIVAAITAVMAQRPAGASGGPSPETTATLQIVGSAVFLPLIVLIAAGILWIAVSLFGEQANYRKLLSVQVYSLTLYLLQAGAGLVVLGLRGVESVSSPADLQPAFGLDLLVPNATGYLGAVLKGINVFSIWGVVVQGIGVTRTHGTSRETGYGAAALAFVVSLLVFSLFALLQPSS
ncbi:MAG TPA: YIP1 family protein [Gemmatimonadales bacterium]|nr:YIP1 family protein [Gemmatimonadales bacterium]